LASCYNFNIPKLALCNESNLKNSGLLAESYCNNDVWLLAQKELSFDSLLALLKEKMIL